MLEETEVPKAAEAHGVRDRYNIVHNKPLWDAMKQIPTGETSLPYPGSVLEVLNQLLYLLPVGYRSLRPSYAFSLLPIEGRNGWTWRFLVTFCQVGKEPIVAAGEGKSAWHAMESTIYQLNDGARERRGEARAELLIKEKEIEDL